MLSLRAVVGLWSRRHQSSAVARAFVDWAEAQLGPPAFVNFEEFGADRPVLLSTWPHHFQQSPQAVHKSQLRNHARHSCESMIN